MTTPHPPASSDIIKTLQQNFGLGSVLLFLFFLVFVRQYFWVISANTLAWTLSFLVALALWYWYFSTSQVHTERSSASFWLIVGLPLLIAYLMRATVPDRSFDVIAYHLLHSERSLRGTLFQTGDYFPSLPLNPAPDTLTGITRLFLGFRFGTIINLLMLLWAGQIADNILRRFIVRNWLRSVSVLLILLFEGFLFELSTYMVDLLTVPLLLQATELTLRADEVEKPHVNFVHVALLLGAAVALKLTGLAVALPILLVCAYQMFAMRYRILPSRLVTTLVFMGVALVAPILPFSVYLFRLTGNPVFPIANSFFKSPYWPIHGGWDARWGPQGLWETVAWPVLAVFKPERHSELALYSGRLSLAFIVAVIGLLVLKRDAVARMLCFIVVTSSLLWSATSLGYSRYGFYQEVLGGITTVAIAALLLRDSMRLVSWRGGVAIVLLSLLAGQSYLGCVYARRKEWGDRPTLLDNPKQFVDDAKLVLRDRSLRDFLSAEAQSQVDQVEVWFESQPKTTGFEVLLNPRAPIIALNQPEFFLTRDALRKFITTVEASASQRMYSLCLADDLPKAKQAIVDRGLEMKNAQRLSLPFFSAKDPIGIMLIEVGLPEDAQAQEQFKTSWMRGAFSPSDYREQIRAVNPPTTMRPGEKVDIDFKVKNLGSTTWPAVGTKDFRFQVNLGNHWIIGGVSSEDSRAVMNADLPPGAETNIRMTVKAPQTPGDYVLEIDLVHEGVTWFKERGASPLALPVSVRP